MASAAVAVHPRPDVVDDCFLASAWGKGRFNFIESLSVTSGSCNWDRLVAINTIFWSSWSNTGMTKARLCHLDLPAGINDSALQLTSELTLF